MEAKKREGAAGGALLLKAASSFFAASSSRRDLSRLGLGALDLLLLPVPPALVLLLDCLLLALLPLEYFIP